LQYGSVAFAKPYGITELSDTTTPVKIQVHVHTHTVTA